jgi:glutamine amidotransferase
MIAIVKYNAGNIQSVMCALNRLGYDAVVTDDVEMIKKADKVIFPGVGEASTAMAYLESTNLIDTLKDLKKPFLGICLGMQLLCERSDENDCRCMGMFDVPVVEFDKTSGFKIPHVGWNTIYDLKSDLYKDVSENSYCYFVHTYYVPVCDYTIAKCEYAGVSFSASIKKDNFYATQFHPEKSGSIGETVLKNFLKMEDK